MDQWGYPWRMSRHANVITLWGYILQDETIAPFDESSDSSTWDFDNLSYLAWSAEDAHGVTVQPTGHTDEPIYVVALTRSIVRGGDWSPVVLPRRPRFTRRERELLDDFLKRFKLRSRVARALTPEPKWMAAPCYW